jgi:hypothetical protein
MGNTFQPERKRDRDEDQASDAEQHPVGRARKRQKRGQAQMGDSGTLSGSYKRGYEQIEAAHEHDDGERNEEPGGGSKRQKRMQAEAGDNGAGGTSSDAGKGAGKREHESSRIAGGPDDDESDQEPEGGTSKRQRVREPPAQPRQPAGVKQPTGARKPQQVQRASAAQNAARYKNDRRRCFNRARMHGGSNALLVHYTLERVPMQKLYSLFCRRASLREPEYVADKGHYKTMAFFQTPADADLVFDRLDGPTSLDCYGLLQKYVRRKRTSCGCARPIGLCTSYENSERAAAVWHRQRRQQQQQQLQQQQLRQQQL